MSSLSYSLTHLAADALSFASPLPSLLIDFWIPFLVLTGLFVVRAGLLFLVELVHSSNPDFGVFRRGAIWMTGNVVLAVIASFCFRFGPSQVSMA